MLFKDVIYPIRPVSFFYDGVRARKIVHLSSESGRSENIYDPMITFENVKSEIRSAPLTSLMYFVSGEAKKPSNFLDIIRAQEENESVLRSYGPNTHNFTELTELEDDIKKAFHSKYAWTNLYWSKKKQALKPHRDPDTIIVLQLHGNKLWNFYKDGIDWKKNEPIEELTMKAGDFLFFPKGTLHSAITEGAQDSVHLTIEIQTPFDRGL